MKTWRCSVCGYIIEDMAAPENCPNCKAPREKFGEVEEGFQQLRMFSGQKFSDKPDVEVNPFFGDFEQISPYIYNLPVGERVPLHKHPTTDEVFYIIKGRVKFTIGETDIVASAGDVVEGKMNVPHTFKNIGSEPVAFLSVKAPKPVDMIMLEEIAATKS